MDRQDEADRRMIKPREGIRVVDLSTAQVGPYCTALLVDMDTEIIKAESLNGGDIAPVAAFQNDHSLYFDSVNRNKRSVCIDLYSAEGREILEKLIVGSDVLVENFKLGTIMALEI